jgi:prepilin-type N-terminal cleavage/methylation domain-containing protein/prepilin-type processing-associated H-X9-DG protein
MEETSMIQKFSLYNERKSRRQGFTLIELLVVIVIIVILAAILFPVFARARENARRASCQSNLKQIGLGILQYTQDYDEKYPGFHWAPANIYWTRQVRPYIKSDQIFQCPSESTTQGNQDNVNYADYFFNRNLNDWDNSANANVGRSLAAVNNPALSIMNGDFRSSAPWEALPAWVSGSEDGNQCSGILGDTGTGHCSSAAALDRTAAKRHLDGAVYSFADGHVKFLKTTQIYGTNTPFSTSGGTPTFRVVD